MKSATCPSSLCRGSSHLKEFEKGLRGGDGGSKYAGFSFPFHLFAEGVEKQRFTEPCTELEASQVALVVKNLPTNAGDVKRYGFYLWVGKISWRRAWQSTPVFLPENPHRQRSLAGYSP